MTNIMHRTAGKIAVRSLGADTPENRRVVYGWASERTPEQRPFAIHKDGRTIYAWENDIAAAGNADLERRAVASQSEQPAASLQS